MVVDTGLWRIRNITVSGYKLDAEEGVFYRRFARELNDEELEDEVNGLWEESMKGVRSMAVDGETEGSESEVRESGMAIDKEEGQNEGEEEAEREGVKAGNKGISSAVSKSGMLE